MRRMTGVFGGSPKPPAGMKVLLKLEHSTRREQGRYVEGGVACLGYYGFGVGDALCCMQLFSAEAFCLAGGNPDSNTLISDQAVVICLDDYHSLDRSGRKREGVTALDPKAQDFDLMYEQVKDMKAGKTVAKPIYNHVSGLIDAPEDTTAAKVQTARGHAACVPSRCVACLLPA